jgi:4'-phosphopantetheinyl transferase
LSAINLWKFSLSGDDADLAGAEQLLSTPERSRAAAFRFNRHRRRFVFRRAMRRILLADIAGINATDLIFNESDHGKPRLVGADFEFNTSHTQDVGVIVTGDVPLGVDIEAVDRPMDYLQFAQRTFTKEEFLDINKERDDDLRLAFFNCWTGKESYIKALGLGLHKNLRSFSVQCTPGAVPGLRWDREIDGDLSSWRFERVSTDNYVATIVAKSTVAQSSVGKADVRIQTLSTESLRAGVPISVE